LTATDRRKARGAVVMDYVDVSAEGAFNNNRMQTQKVPADVDNGAVISATPVWYIDANLTAQVHTTWGMYIEKMIFAGRHLGRWIHVEAAYNRARVRRPLDVRCSATVSVKQHFVVRRAWY
jgi:hypothetical protein